MRLPRREIWALLAVQALFASNAVVGRINVLWLGSRLLVLLRVVGAALIFLAVARRIGARRPTSRRDLTLLFLCSILGVALNQALYLTGLAYSTATHASVIGTSVPVFTAAVAVLAGQERLNLRKVLGIGLALGGALYLARVGSGTFRLQLPGRSALPRQLPLLRTATSSSGVASCAATVRARSSSGRSASGRSSSSPSASRG